MAVSNATGAIVLTTGNKSEMATGYSTLYGDSAGGFAVIKDVPKTLVYELCRYRNARAARRRRPRARSPTRSWSRPRRPNCGPTSATTSRCRPTTSSTPCSSSTSRTTPTAEELIAARPRRRDWCGASPRWWTAASTSAARCPPGCAISKKAFGRDRRMPITNAFSPRAVSGRARVAAPGPSTTRSTRELGAAAPAFSADGAVVVRLRGGPRPSASWPWSCARPAGRPAARTPRWPSSWPRPRARTRRGGSPSTTWPPSSGPRLLVTVARPARGVGRDGRACCSSRRRTWSAPRSSRRARALPADGPDAAAWRAASRAAAEALDAAGLGAAGRGLRRRLRPPV